MNRSEVKFVQFNTGKRLVATLELTENNVVYLIQEPYLYEGKRGAVISSKDFYCSPKGRTAIYTPNLQDAQFTIINHFVKRDLVAGILENRKFKKGVVIASIYLDILQQVKLKDWQDLKVYCRKEHLPLLCGIDSNTWSYLWFSSKENRRGMDLESFLLDERAQIHNIGSTATFYRQRRGEVPQESIIDITVSFNLKEQV